MLRSVSFRNCLTPCLEANVLIKLILFRKLFKKKHKKGLIIQPEYVLSIRLTHFLYLFIKNSAIFVLLLLLLLQSVNLVAILTTGCGRVIPVISLFSECIVHPMANRQNTPKIMFPILPNDLLQFQIRVINRVIIP